MSGLAREREREREGACRQGWDVSDGQNSHTHTRTVCGSNVLLLAVVTAATTMPGAAAFLRLKLFSSSTLR